jgi:hypothetical protein
MATKQRCLYIALSFIRIELHLFVDLVFIRTLKVNPREWERSSFLLN